MNLPASPLTDTLRRGAQKYEVALTLALAVVTIAWSAQAQAFQVFRFWDSDEYYLMAEQFAANTTVTAALPYANRVFVPWLVGKCCPGTIQQAFLAINLIAGVTLSVMLIYWLRRFVANPLVRVLVTAAFTLHWLSPVRFAFYYPAYVDPVFQVLVLWALMVGESLMRRPSATIGLLYVSLVALGVFARENMLVVPVCALVGSALGRERVSRAYLNWATVAFGAGAVALVVTLSMVSPRAGYGFVDAAIAQLARKPLYSLPLACFLVFGPMLAVVAYDWRATWAFLQRRADLAAWPVISLGLAYAGGTDTERLLFWAMPVIYLLIAQSLERHFAVVSSGAVAAAVVAGQVLSQRVFWPVPDPTREVTPLAETTGLVSRLYAIANRVFVIDDFHWNLWSTFGSRPFHVVQLAFYAALSAAIIAMMRRRSGANREIAE